MDQLIEYCSRLHKVLDKAIHTNSPIKQATEDAQKEVENAKKLGAIIQQHINPYIDRHNNILEKLVTLKRIRQFKSTISLIYI